MDKELFKLLKEMKEEYRNWKPVYCQALEEAVFFTMHGFNHLRFRSGNTTRNSKELRQRLHLLSEVRTILRNAQSVVSYRQRISRRVKSGKEKESEYWAIEGSVGKGNSTIRIVLTKTKGMGNIQFLSVMKRK